MRKKVTPELEGPLDRAVRAAFPTSWGKARDWIVKGKVSSGGVVVTDPTARARAGTEIALDERAPRPGRARLADEDVAYVDPHVVVVRKPPGISTIPYAPGDADTLDARVRAWLEARGKARGGRPNLGVVHRLDKETSGLVVFTPWRGTYAVTLSPRRARAARA